MFPAFSRVYSLVEKVPWVEFSQKQTQVYGYRWFTWDQRKGKGKQGRKEGYKSVFIAIVWDNYGSVLLWISEIFHAVHLRVAHQLSAVIGLGLLLGCAWLDPLCSLSVLLWPQEAPRQRGSSNHKTEREQWGRQERHPLFATEGQRKGQEKHKRIGIFCVKLADKSHSKSVMLT